ncbi:hypothetical protein QBC34DRAFT_472106 [Podospora aff. communis PSN243]|uniref:Uncharacterized protein n=1 Tax=Podospora aff. communis PSN243 TaxID=3040156 RepID=A0AAV9GAY1_9PEZI|nr:hypothetical protein QBC34DRAFT_472106 [Podospora aff. communis PSN243]
MASWFPIGQDESGGWRLDIVALLAVTGESFIGEHAQALTSFTLCLLPRIMPAPHALLQPRRPTSLPAEVAKVTSVYGDTVLDSVPFFANIIHPIDQLRPFPFIVLEIKHKDPMDFRSDPVFSLSDAELPQLDATPPGSAVATAVDPENGHVRPNLVRRQPTMTEKVAGLVSNAPQLRRTESINVPPIAKMGRYAVPPALHSPLHVLSVLSFIMSIGLIVAGIVWKDGTAVVAVCLLSLATSVIGYAAWWRPLLMHRPMRGKHPQGDVIIRTREAAVLLIKCREEVARELYSGAEECQYVSTGIRCRLFMTLGAILMMPSVILLGNCSFNMQALVGAAYLFLNITYWVIGMLPLKYSWDLSRYEVRDSTQDDARDAHLWMPVSSLHHENPEEGYPSLVRTIWYAIRETKQKDWVIRSGAVPQTENWMKWIVEATEAAKRGERSWPAVSRYNEIVGEGFENT